MLQNNVQNCTRAMKGTKPCIALMGEFSAGKTTLINFLLGEEVLPTQVTATHVPPVWISQGVGEAFYIDSENYQYPLDLSDIQSLDVANVRYIKIFSDAAILDNLDLIDTPGISDPNIPEFHKETAIENADAMIWCTHATQAWRESERSAWVSLPEELRAGSILLATRSDKLDERSRERVRRRLVREAGDLFESIIMFSATDALLAVQDEDLEELLVSSGGQLLRETLQNLTQEIASVSGAAKVSAIRPVRVQRQADSDTLRPVGAEADIVSASVQELYPEADVAVDDDVQEDDFTSNSPTSPLVLGADADTYFVSDAEQEASEDHEFDDQSIEEADWSEDDYEDDTYDGQAGAMDGYDPGLDEDVADEAAYESNDDLERLQSVHEMLRRSEPARDEVDSTVEFAEEAPDAPQTARALWQQTLAINNVETVADILAAIEEFVDALDQHQMFAGGR